MDIISAIKKRKSVRDFKKDPVSRKVLEEILEVSCRAPSAMNTQPWKFTVVAGDVLDNIKKDNVEKLRAGQKPNPDHIIVSWPKESVYRNRQVGLAIQLFKLMDIARDDLEKRAAWMERGFRYFNAPAAIIISMDRQLSETGPLLDLGAVMQTICLVAMHYDLATCIEDQGVMYPEVLRKYANISDSQRIMIAIAIGYADWDFPANAIITDREKSDNITNWCGF